MIENQKESSVIDSRKVFKLQKRNLSVGGLLGVSEYPPALFFPNPHPEMRITFKLVLTWACRPQQLWHYLRQFAEQDVRLCSASFWSQKYLFHIFPTCFNGSQEPWRAFVKVSGRFVVRRCCIVSWLRLSQVQLIRRRLCVVLLDYSAVGSAWYQHSGLIETDEVFFVTRRWCHGLFMVRVVGSLQNNWKLQTLRSPLDQNLRRTRQIQQSPLTHLPSILHWVWVIVQHSLRCHDVKVIKMLFHPRTQQ